PRQTAVVGDQIFTDVLGANLAGMPSILVEPFQMEPFFRFRLKRFLEKGILRRYWKKQRRREL
ncbi:MAG TPA: YqeG family HAD IIIA-type phosphatase, partial [Ruminococcaceae bacterium]|nr:YqeG family HAD IIIA-type phosphatase [Oscillospiraceae bacterium]